MSLSCLQAAVSLIPLSVGSSKCIVSTNLRAGVFRGAGGVGWGGGKRRGQGSAQPCLLALGLGWGKDRSHRVKRAHQLLCHPQALDDANKGIIEELKKTNYREILKDEKEKGEFWGPEDSNLRTLPLLSFWQPSPRFPATPSVGGLALLTKYSDFSAATNPSLSWDRRGRPRAGVRSCAVCPISSILPYFFNQFINYLLSTCHVPGRCEIWEETEARSLPWRSPQPSGKARQLELPATRAPAPEPAVQGDGALL